MTTFIEELDQIILDLVHTGSMMPRGKTINADMFSEDRLAILNLVSERIIGDDDYPAPGYRVLTLSKKHRNELRAEQRTTLYEGTKEKV